MRNIEDSLPVWAQYLIGGILGLVAVAFLAVVVWVAWTA